MNSLQEYSLLVAVAVPVLAIVGLNLFLAITGERDTLMLPGPMTLAPVEAQARASEVTVVREESARTIDTVQSPANDELARQAA